MGYYLYFFFFFFDNNPPKSEPYIEGYVVEADFNRILVINGITEEQSKNINEKEALNLVNVEAIWVSKYNFFQFRKGQKVRVWVGGTVAESFPAQGKADYIEIISK
ncbi:YobA family protein [Planococcus sp. A6]|uniref:YobA family protein n=1 Tax=Planococcus sp. A6 TaxID=2992760 RepID=UPI00237B1941|nr:YobA family protein [Planococcus sp. A6]MDE0583604.1 YobA family protein [Planococcus sp. A6]